MDTNPCPLPTDAELAAEELPAINRLYRCDHVIGRDRVNGILVNTIDLAAILAMLTGEAVTDADRAADPMRTAAEDPKLVHEAMSAAPIDGKPYRQARAAICWVVEAWCGAQ